MLGLSVPNSPLIAKAYDAGLIKVTDISDGVVGDLSTFRGRNSIIRARTSPTAWLVTSALSEVGIAS
jgi:hypothetical protein